MSAGFGSVLRAEWTKFATVPGWVAAMLVGGVLVIGLGLGPSMSASCGQDAAASRCALPVGPDGEGVTDRFTVVHRSLTGDGSLTVRLSSLTGLIPGRSAGTSVGLAPWAKAGLIVTADLRPGSSYAAVMVTGRHGVRMQYDYLHDRAGVSAAPPRWLRLTRRGATLTGAESTDGQHWTTVGTAHPRGLGTTVQAGLFTTSPHYSPALGSGGPSSATGVFDHLDQTGRWSAGGWTGTIIGGGESVPSPGGSVPSPGGYQRTAGGYTLTGSGDIAPVVAGAAGLGTTVSQTLLGTFVGLLVVVVVATMVVTAEYRRGLIATTLAASPRRGQVLAAKALVVGGLAVLVGLVGTAVVVTVGPGLLRANGVTVHAVTGPTQVRLVVGTGALLGVCAVLALGIGAILRRGTAAVATSIGLIVVPYFLIIGVLPPGSGEWLLRFSPAAGFAVQQSAVQYAQVDNVYTASSGYFPLSPLAGFGVLCVWAAAALALATFLLRRRDA